MRGCLIEKHITITMDITDLCATFKKLNLEEVDPSIEKLCSSFDKMSMEEKQIAVCKISQYLKILLSKKRCETAYNPNIPDFIY